MTAEWTNGYAVRTFTYNDAGQMTEATVFTLTTKFKYNGDSARLAVEVVGQGTTTYTVDYGGGYHVLAEETVTGTLLYLYGRECLGQYDDEWLYYLDDATGYVRQGTDGQGAVVSTWLFDPDGLVLEGARRMQASAGPVSHLIPRLCSGQCVPGGVRLVDGADPQGSEIFRSAVGPVACAGAAGGGTIAAGAEEEKVVDAVVRGGDLCHVCGGDGGMYGSAVRFADRDGGDQRHVHQHTIRDTRPADIDADQHAHVNTNRDTNVDADRDTNVDADGNADIHASAADTCAIHTDGPRCQESRTTNCLRCL